MTLANLTRSLLIASAMLLCGAASVAADEPGNGLPGGAVGGAGDAAETGAATVADHPVADDLPVEPIVDAVEPVTRPVERVVAPVVTRVVEPAPTVLKPVVDVTAPVIETITTPAAPVVKAVTQPAAPAVALVAPVVEPLTKPVTRGLRPATRPVQELIPVPKLVIDEVATPIVDAVDPVTESAAPAVTPLLPVLEAATEVTRPITDPVGRVVAPVLGPEGLGPILDPVLRPGSTVTPVPVTAGETPSGMTSTVTVQTGHGASHAVRAGQTPDQPAARRVGAGRGALDRQPPSPASHAATPHAPPAMQSPVLLAAITGELVGSAPDGGFTLVIVAMMVLALIASRSALSAISFARPPTPSFAPAVPPA